MAVVLAADVGTSSARARLFDANGDPAGDLAQEQYVGERDPDRLVEVVGRVVAEARASAESDAVALSCFGHSLLPLDSRGRPLTPILDWRDTRSAAAARELRRRLDARAVHERTGCHLHPSYWPAKLAWLRTEEPETFAAAERFVGFGEYLLARLHGLDAAAASVSLASATGLLDLAAGRWDEELLDELGVAVERLPELSDEPVTEWFPALLDGACSNLGAGCVGRRRAALMVGTSGAVRVLHDDAGARPRAGLFLYQVDARRVLEGGALSDGGNLYHWLGETLAAGEERVAEREPAAHGLTFLTLLGGERSPGWATDATGAVTGLTLATTPADVRQAALEGVAFRFAEILELMPDVEEIVASGGALLADDDWVRILADVLERPIEVSAVDEASLRGAAVAALERLGERPAPGGVSRTIEPRPGRYEALRAARARHRELYDLLIRD